MSLPRSNPFFVILIFIAVIAGVIFYGSQRSAAFHKAAAADATANQAPSR